MYLQVFGSLILVLAVLLVSLKLLKQYMPGMNGTRDLAISEQLQLGDRCRVMLVKVRNKELLIGVTRERITLLDTLGPQS